MSAAHVVALGLPGWPPVRAGQEHFAKPDVDARWTAVALTKMYNTITSVLQPKSS
jgi:hypothetical protein